MPKTFLLFLQVLVLQKKNWEVIWQHWCCCAVANICKLYHLIIFSYVDVCTSMHTKAVVVVYNLNFYFFYCFVFLLLPQKLLVTAISYMLPKESVMISNLMISSFKLALEYLWLLAVKHKKNNTNSQTYT